VDYSILNDLLTNLKNAAEVLRPELPWKLQQHDKTLRGNSI